MTITDVEGMDMLKELMYDATIAEYIDERSAYYNPESDAIPSDNKPYIKFIRLAEKIPVALSGQESGLVQRIYLEAQALKKTDALIRHKRYFSGFLEDIDQALIEYREHLEDHEFGSMNEMGLYFRIGEKLNEYMMGIGIISPDFVSAVDEFFSMHFNGDSELKKRVWQQNCILKWDLYKMMSAQMRLLKNDFGKSYS
jgi:DNA-dependent RNA polymerase auxiliary subunit epsilon